jgi:hypothetical protein
MIWRHVFWSIFKSKGRNSKDADEGTSGANNLMSLMIFAVVFAIATRRQSHLSNPSLTQEPPQNL